MSDRRITRRSVLKLGGAGGAAYLLRPATSRALPVAIQIPYHLLPVSPAEAGCPPLTHQTSVLRADDLLVAQFLFHNLVLSGDGTRLVRQNPGLAVVVVRFPPQSLAERAFFEPSGPDTTDPPTEPPVPSRLAGTSRLAFTVPSDVDELEYTVPGLLAWVRLVQRVVPVAAPAAAAQPTFELTEAVAEAVIQPSDQVFRQAGQPNPVRAAVQPARQTADPILVAVLPPQIRPPASCETAIEAPWNVFLSPSNRAGWAHASAPVVHHGRTELWHTRLGVRLADGPAVDEQNATQRIVRAIWTPGFDRDTAPDEEPAAPASDPPFRTTLGNRDRWQVVRLSSDHQISGYTPLPVDVDRLMLTSLGAWLDTRAIWNPPTGIDPDLDMVSWRHRATMGRDHYVRVVRKGYVFPFGNPAVIIKISERKFQNAPSGLRAAFLRQREFIVIQRPEKTYPAFGQPQDARDMPFRSVRVTNLVTPPIDAGNTVGATGGRWIRVAGADHLFHIVAEDWEGRRVEFSIPMLFVLGGSAIDHTKMTDLVAHYNGVAGGLARRERPMDGQLIAYAPTDKPGDTAQETSVFRFGARTPDSPIGTQTLDAQAQPAFYPKMVTASLRLPAAEQAAGSSLGATPVELYQPFVDGGFAASPKGVYLAMTGAGPGVTFPADRSGGVVTPNLGVSGVSREKGPVGGSLDDLTSGIPNPADFFSDAKILGGILLAEIIDAVSFGNHVPELTTRLIYPGDDKTQPPQKAEVKLHLQPKIQADPLQLFEPASPDNLTIDATLVTALDPSAESTYEIVGELSDFTMNLFGTGATQFLIMDFDRLRFTARTDEKPNVDVKIRDVQFAGALTFVNELQSLLQSGDTGLSIDIKPTGIMAGYTLPLPAIQVGVFNLSNMSLSAGLNIPFDGSPVRVRFAFCERENPFLLTVSMFGGGGFFGVGIGLDGVELLEASLEFGAGVGFDIGVASGSVSIMAGIYFKYEDSAGAELTGYLKAEGELEVLGLITVSALLYLGFTYMFSKDICTGQALFRVEIDLLIFSATVETTVERSFGGDPSDPTFADLWDQSHWDEYCDAYATP